MRIVRLIASVLFLAIAWQIFRLEERFLSDLEKLPAWAGILMTHAGVAFGLLGVATPFLKDFRIWQSGKGEGP